MFKIFGYIFMIASVIGGYIAAGGYLIALWQPPEVVIIGGAGLGAFFVANPITIQKKAWQGTKSMFKEE